MQINITPDQLIINETPMRFPLNAPALEALLGAARLNVMKANHIYTWDDTGVYAYSKNGTGVETLAIDLRQNDYQFSPKSPFTAELTIAGEDFRNYFQQHAAALKKYNKRDESGSLIVGGLSVMFEIEEGIIQSVSISIAPPPKVYSDKYKMPPKATDKIEFRDFNFKLAVVQQLMYEKKLIQPEFDLYEFVENHQEREIDVEDEGYEFIPEVTAWFEQLEVDKKLAGEITEINQDGGDDIYGHVLRFWDGEDDTFNIVDFDDVAHFPHLRRMNLFYADNLDEIKAQLAPKGIAVEAI